MPQPAESDTYPPRAHSGEPKHILYLIDVLWGLGGAERALLRMVKLLPRDRYRCTIGTFRQRPGWAKHEIACPVREFPMRRIFGWQAFRAALELRSLIQTERVALVHTFFESADLFGAPVSKWSGCPVVVSSRRDMGILRSPRHHLAYRFVSPLFDQVQAVSGAVRQQVIQSDRLDPRKVVTVPNGIEIDRIAAANGATAWRALQIEDAAPRIVSVGNIRYVKGFDVLLRAARLVCDVHPKAIVLIAGSVQEPECYRRLQELVVELGLSSNVRFTGDLDNETVWSLLKCCDVFCLPSRSEGMSNALLEAMGCGLPSVATAVGGTPEVLEDGRTGHLVPSEDYGAVADRLLRLLGEPARAREMGEAARIVIEDRFSATAMVNQVVGLYDQLLDRR
jgi:glycosyltransferase involved in cell wall biosynthesis